MNRHRALRTLQLGVPVAAAVLFASEVSTFPTQRTPEIVFFAALAALAFRLRVRRSCCSTPPPR